MGFAVPGLMAIHPEGILFPELQYSNENEVYSGTLLVKNYVNILFPSPSTHPPQQKKV